MAAEPYPGGATMEERANRYVAYIEEGATRRPSFARPWPPRLRDPRRGPGNRPSVLLERISDNLLTYVKQML